MDPLTILAALGPLAVDLGKSLIGRFIQTDVYKPVNVGKFLALFLDMGENSRHIYSSDLIKSNRIRFQDKMTLYKVGKSFAQQ